VSTAAGGAHPVGDPAQHVPHLGHDRGGVPVVAGHVPDDELGAAVGDPEGVVPVTAHLHPTRRRHVAGGDLQLIGLHGGGEQDVLQRPGHPPGRRGRGLFGLSAQQTVQRRGALGGEGVEQRDVAGGEVLGGVPADGDRAEGHRPQA
jgi:hypothetical protein